MLLRLAKAGTSLTGVAESVIRINDAFKSESKGKVAAAIKDASVEKFTGMGLDPNISEATKNMLIQLSSVSDDYLATVLELATGEDKFTTEAQKQVQELRKLFDARGLLLTQSKDILNVNAAIHEAATSHVSAGFTDVGTGIENLVYKAAFSQMSSGDPNNTTSTQSLDEQLADWKAAEDKLKQYKALQTAIM